MITEENFQEKVLQTNVNSIESESEMNTAKELSMSCLEILQWIRGCLYLCQVPCLSTHAREKIFKRLDYNLYNNDNQDIKQHSFLLGWIHANITKEEDVCTPDVLLNFVEQTILLISKLSKQQQNANNVEEEEDDDDGSGGDDDKQGKDETRVNFDTNRSFQAFLLGYLELEQSDIIHPSLEYTQTIDRISKKIQTSVLDDNMLAFCQHIQHILSESVGKQATFWDTSRVDLHNLYRYLRQLFEKSDENTSTKQLTSEKWEAIKSFYGYPNQDEFYTWLFEEKIAPMYIRDANTVNKKHSIKDDTIPGHILIK